MRRPVVAAVLLALSAAGLPAVAAEVHGAPDAGRPAEPVHAQTPPVAPGAGEKPLKTAKGKSEPIYTASVTEEFRIPTEHGSIYGVVRRPVVPAGVRVPVILTYSPYNVIKAPHNAVNLVGGSTTDATGNYYVPRGYARAVFDLVGTRESGGCADFGGIRERETGKAVVDFLGSRPWSNGRVGMIGGSYDGTTQWATAIEQPKHLVTIVPQVAIDRWYDYAFYGGVRRYSGFGTPLLFDFGFGAPPSTDPRDPGHFASVNRDRVEVCDRVHNQARGYGPDPIWDRYWDERDYRSKAGRIKASVLAEGGWLDRNVNPVGTLKMWQALPDTHPKKLVMGQWGHAAPNLKDWVDVRHAWFDYWLLGYDGRDDADDLPDTGVMQLPRVDTVLPGQPVGSLLATLGPRPTGVREQLRTFPPPGTSELALPFGRGGLALKSRDATFTGSDPTLSNSGAASGNCGDACVVFEGAPLARDTRVAGTPAVDVAAVTRSLERTSATVSTQLVTVLYSVSPTGARKVLSTGMLNSRNRDGLRTSSGLADGVAWRGTVSLYDVDVVVPAGHRLGVSVSSYTMYEAFTPDNDAPTSTEVLAGKRGSVLRLPVAPLPVPVAEPK